MATPILTPGLLAPEQSPGCPPLHTHSGSQPHPVLRMRSWDTTPNRSPGDYPSGRSGEVMNSASSTRSWPVTPERPHELVSVPTILKQLVTSLTPEQLAGSLTINGYGSPLTMLPLIPTAVRPVPMTSLSNGSPAPPGEVTLSPEARQPQQARTANLDSLPPVMTIATTVTASGNGYGIGAANEGRHLPSVITGSSTRIVSGVGSGSGRGADGEDGEIELSPVWGRDDLQEMGGAEEEVITDGVGEHGGAGKAPHLRAYSSFAVKSGDDISSPTAGSVHSMGLVVSSGMGNAMNGRGGGMGLGMGLGLGLGLGLGIGVGGGGDSGSGSGSGAGGYAPDGTNMPGMGMGNMGAFMGLTLNRSKFGSLFSRYDTADTEASADKERERERERTKPAANAVHMLRDGNVRVGPFVLSEFGIKEWPETMGRSCGGDMQLVSMRSVLLRLEHVGTGASAMVYKAIHIPTLTQVAAKTIFFMKRDRQHDLPSELRALAANRSELTSDLSPSNAATAAAGCPNVVSFYDAFLDPAEDSITFLIEYMDAGSLADIVVTGGCKSESVLANIAWRVMSGLAYLHEKRVIHRDIKPDNILINQAGDIKISDFGVSKYMDPGEDTLKELAGTTAYLSPEVLAGQDYSFNLDVWSFGITLLTVALGKMPIPEEHRTSFWDLLQFLETNPVPAAPPGMFSADFTSFIAACLTREPGEYWRRISECVPAVVTIVVLCSLFN